MNYKWLGKTSPEIFAANYRPPVDPTYSLQSTIVSNEHWNRIADRDNAAKTAIRELDFQIETYKSEEEILEARIAAARSTPGHMWRAAGVLAYLVAIGIAVPLLLMPASISEPIPDWHRWSVVGGFVLGLVISLALLVTQLYRFRSDGHSAT